MKAKKLLLIMAAVFLAIGWGGAVQAFHDGGVAHCDGCHSMHNSAENPVEGTPNGLLMIGSDPSSTCLNCHQGAGSASSYHIFSNNATVLSPGGDFFWLTQDYSVNLGWTTRNYEGQNTGHNVVATDFGLAQDTNNTTAPGGTYSSAYMSCTSCHDPHGQVMGGTAAGQLPIEGSGSYGGGPTDPATAIVGNYRLLGDSEYTAPGGLTFNSDAPIAATVGYGEADGAHVDYGSGMSEWCGNCHGSYLNDNTMHPAGNSVTLDTFAINYNAYVETGDFGGLPASSYMPLVPFERGESDRTLLDPTRTDGPVSGSNVMCLTCHRAHASAFQNATRWDMQTELVAHSVPTTTQVPAMASDAVPYYGNTFGEFQRSLCNKCHVQD